MWLLPPLAARVPSGLAARRGVLEINFATITLEGMRSLELFAGGGGLALGCSLAGFHTKAVVEWDHDACQTLRLNAAHGHPLADWSVIEGDVRSVDWSQFKGVDLVSGGPPCQPFSAGGKSMAADDPRDMFPAAAEAIRAVRPRAFILENVRGLTRSRFANYYSYIQLRLAHPEIIGTPNEPWEDHYARLQAEDTAGSSSDLQYRVLPTLVNAADYGVPQQRHRVFFVGFRTDVEAEWTFPRQSHSLDALLHSQYVTCEYWTKHGIAPRPVPERWAKRVEKISEGLIDLEGRSPWRTVRDTISSLPAPRSSGSRKHMDHVLQPGARSYPGHTGSELDLPSKALKAGVHGVPGGENMLKKDSGRVRYFTVREAARIQTFPEHYELHGAWSEVMRQLGNAVPVRLAQTVAGSVAEHLAIARAREEIDAGRHLSMVAS